MPVEVPVEAMELVDDPIPSHSSSEGEAEDEREVGEGVERAAAAFAAATRCCRAGLGTRRCIGGRVV